MNNNVNVLSVNSASAKETVKASTKAVSVNTKQENFSKTLDQAQQAREQKSANSTDKYDAAADKDSAPKAADSKDKAASGKDAQAKAKNTKDAKGTKDVSDAQQGVGEKLQAGAVDKSENTQESQGSLENPQAAALLAAEAQASLVQDVPMAELNTYFKGDARLQSVQDDAQVQPLTADEALPGTALQQAGKQQMDNPLDSLQPVQSMEQVQKVEKTDAAQVETPVQSVQTEAAYVPSDIAALLGGRQLAKSDGAGTITLQQQDADETASYAPNDIAALLGGRQTAKAGNAEAAVVLQSQQDKGQQMLNLLAGQQGAYTAAQPAVQQAQEDTVSVTQMANLTDGLEVVDADAQQEIPVAASVQQQSLADGSQQQSMSNGQQQGSQLPGEASFDVVLPGQQDSRAAELDQPSQQGVSFQQVMDNQMSSVQHSDGDVSQASQPRETYNVPQQIVEQARLLQRGTDSEMIIKLNPEHLGQLSLKVSVNGNGGVTATFHTDNAQVRAILETTMTQLKQQLDEQGIKVDNVEVQTGLPDGQLPQDQGQQGFYQQQGGQHIRSQRADLEDFEESGQNLAAEAESVEETQKVVLDSQGNQISRGVDYTV